MSAPRVIVSPALDSEVAKWFVRAARDHAGGFRVALSGGRTPEALLQRLARPPLSEEVQWQRIELFQVDERCVPSGHPDSNRGMIERCLLASLLARPATHWMRTELPPAEAARSYDEEMRHSLGEPPVLDLVLLGMGEDGHTASLFPGTEALSEERQLAAANYVGKLGAWRITLTWPVLEAARAVWFLVAGESKADVLRRVLVENDASLPATRLLGHGSTVWFIDEPAAAQLPAEILEGRTPR